MSWDALSWAGNQKAGGMSDKVVLLTLADACNKQGFVYMSAAAIADFAECDRKTVADALHRLEDKRLIIDTGYRVGATGQVTVWILGGVATNGAPPGKPSKRFPPEKLFNPTPLDGDDAKSPDSGHISEAKTPDSGGLNGANADSKVPAFSVKGTQKRGTEPVLNLTPSESTTPQSLESARVALPTKPKRAKARTPLSPDFRPNDASQAYRKRTMAHWPLTDIKREFEAFLNHHIGAGTLMADWDAAWRKWLANAEGYRLERERRSASYRRDKEWIDNPLARQ